MGKRSRYCFQRLRQLCLCKRMWKWQWVPSKSRLWLKQRHSSSVLSPSWICNVIASRFIWFGWLLVLQILKDLLEQLTQSTLAMSVKVNLFKYLALFRKRWNKANMTPVLHLRINQSFIAVSYTVIPHMYSALRVPWNVCFGVLEFSGWPSSQVGGQV